MQVLSRIVATDFPLLIPYFTEHTALIRPCYGLLSRFSWLFQISGEFKM